MIDIHSHYIPAIDDGSASFEESVAMLRMAAEHGTTSIVATPHASLEYAFNPAHNAEQLAMLQEAAGDVINLYLGCDLHLTFDNIRDALDNPDRYTINGRNYLLVEFSDLLIFKNMDEIFDNFLRSGIIPVVTHPERNSLLQQRLPQLKRWVEMGCKMQVTAGSLLGAWGGKAKKFSEELLDEDLVHFIASDAHDTRRRPPRMDEAYAWLEERLGEAVARRLCIENPGVTLTGDPLPAPAPEPAERRGGWLSMFGRR